MDFIMKLFEILMLVLLMVVGIGNTFFIEEPAFSLQKDYLGVSGYPTILGYVLAFYCLTQIVWILWRKKSEAIKIERGSSTVFPIGLATCYLIAIPIVGFTVSSFFYLYLMPFLIDSTNWRKNTWINLVYAFFVTLLLYMFFRTFKVYLPSSIFFD